MTKKTTKQQQQLFESKIPVLYIILFVNLTLILTGVDIFLKKKTAAINFFANIYLVRPVKIDFNTILFLISRITTLCDAHLDLGHIHSTSWPFKIHSSL